MTRRHDRAVNAEGNRKHPRLSALALGVAMALALPGTAALAQSVNQPTITKDVDSIAGIDIIVRKKLAGVWQLMPGSNTTSIRLPIDAAGRITGRITEPGDYTVSTACRAECPPHRITGTPKDPGGDGASPSITLTFAKVEVDYKAVPEFDFTLRQGTVDFSGQLPSLRGGWIIPLIALTSDRKPATEEQRKLQSASEEQRKLQSASEEQRKIKMTDVLISRSASGLPVPADYDGDGTSDRSVPGPVAGSDLPRPIQDVFTKLRGERASDFFSFPLEPTLLRYLFGLRGPSLSAASAGAGDPQAGPPTLLTELLVVIAAAAPKGGGKPVGADSPGNPITGITISLPANPDASVVWNVQSLNDTSVGLESDSGSVRVNNRVDSNGAFHFTGLPQGNFKLFIGDQPFKSVRVGPDGFIAGKVAISGDLPGERTVFIVNPKPTGTASAWGPGTVSVFDGRGNLMETRNTVAFVVNNGFVNTASGAGAADRSDTAGSRKPTGFGSGSAFGAGAGPGSAFPGMGPGPSGAGPSAPRPDIRGPMGGPSPMGPGTPRR